MKNYFSGDELKCPCCGEAIIDPDFLDHLNMAREIAGFDFVVTSGYRCQKRNAEVGSTSTNHTRGKAADIRCTEGWTRYKMINAMIIAGILGIGIGEKFIHCDMNRPGPAIWTY